MVDVNASTLSTCSRVEDGNEVDRNASELNEIEVVESVGRGGRKVVTYYYRKYMYSRVLNVFCVCVWKSFSKKWSVL